MQTDCSNSDVDSADNIWICIESLKWLSMVTQFNFWSMWQKRTSVIENSFEASLPLDCCYWFHWVQNKSFNWHFIMRMYCSHKSPVWIGNQFLLPATKLGQGNIFRSVCQEFCSQGGGGSPGPHPRGKLRGLAGGVSRSTPGGGGSPGPGPGCIPICTEADSPQQTATAAGGTHPTGMHSCQLNVCRFDTIKWTSLIVKTKTNPINRPSTLCHALFDKYMQLLQSTSESTLS